MISKNEMADLLLSIDSKHSGLIKVHEIFTMIVKVGQEKCALVR